MENVEVRLEIFADSQRHFEYILRYFTLVDKGYQRDTLREITIPRIIPHRPLWNALYRRDNVKDPRRTKD